MSTITVLAPAVAWPERAAVAFCDWCEEPADRKRKHWGHDSDICEACDVKIEEREADEWERSLSREECLAWQRARDAGVD